MQCHGDHVVAEGVTVLSRGLPAGLSPGTRVFFFCNRKDSLINKREKKGGEGQAV